MKFISTHQNLINGISKVSALAGRNPQLPILQHVLVEVKEGVLNLTCTDLEVGAHVVVTGKAEKEGGLTVSARKLTEFIQQLPADNPITLELKGKKLSITTNSYHADFSVTGTDDFPLLPLPSKQEKITIDGRLFCQGLSHTIFSAAKDETRPELHSILVNAENNELRLVATDSFRLSEKIINLNPNQRFSFLLPLNAAQEIIRLFNNESNLNLLIEKNYVSFQSEGCDLSTRLIEGTYPNYRQIIPQQFLTNGLVNRDELLRALKVLSVLIPRDSRRISLHAQPSEELIQLQVDGGEDGSGEVEIPFSGQGKETNLLFNIQYLLDGIQHINGKEVQLSLGSASDPLVMRPQTQNEQQLYVVMPIQT